MIKFDKTGSFTASNQLTFVLFGYRYKFASIQGIYVRAIKKRTLDVYEQSAGLLPGFDLNCTQWLILSINR